MLRDNPGFAYFGHFVTVAYGIALRPPQLCEHVRALVQAVQRCLPGTRQAYSHSVLAEVPSSPERLGRS